MASKADRPTQADRRALSRSALLESAARGLSRYGYGNLVLEQVAAEAGYSRGALYHLFKGKEALSLAAMEWVLERWEDEVGVAVRAAPGPVAALLTLAREHAIFCRRDVARVAVALRLEFAGQDHPIGRHVEASYEQLARLCVRLIEQARDAGAITPGPPARILALAVIGAIEGPVILLAGLAPYDELLVVRAVAGVLGVDPALAATPIGPSTT